VAFNRYDPATCVAILHIKALGWATRYSNINASFIPQSTLLAEARCLSYRCWISLQVVSTSTTLVCYHTGVRSIALKPTMHFFSLLSDHLNQYLQLHSLVHKEPLFYGEFKTTIKITIQILIYLRNPQKYSTIPSTWSSYFKNPYIRQLRKTAPNSRSSGVGNLQLQTDTLFSHFVIWLHWAHWATVMVPKEHKK